jgi:hypothetical protein
MAHKQTKAKLETVENSGRALAAAAAAAAEVKCFEGLNGVLLSSLYSNVYDCTKTPY